ncbi:hypothetical protein C8A05DRAFT_20606, partial [Staphylotrichum tortipilum]
QHRAHEGDLGWLNEQVRGVKEGQRVVVLTHYCPTVDERAVEARHRGSEVASGFATDLSGEGCWTSPVVVMWAFGHTHYCCYFWEGRKRVVANQRGYALALQQGFDAEKVFMVGEQEGGG